MFGLTSQAKGMVAYLRELRNAANERYKSANWNGAQELRSDIDKTASLVENLSATDEGFPSAAKRLGI